MVKSSIVQSRFSRAVESYDSSARAQREICVKLFSLLKRWVTHTPRCFEFGCGTGNLSREIATLSPCELLLNDLCESYRNILSTKLPQGGYQFVSGDAAEYMVRMSEESALHKFDLIASASSLQWFDDPFGLLDSAVKLLHEGGILAISTFASQNISEVTSLSGRGLSYPSLEALCDHLTESGYEVLHSSTESIELHFESPIDVLNHLRQSGVTGSSHSGGWSKGDLRRFIERYKRVDGVCPLTYRPIYIVARLIINDKL